MAWETSDFVEAIYSEIGDDLAELLTPERAMRWVNEAQARLRFYRQMTSALTWAADVTSVAVPTDFHHIEKIVPDSGSSSFPTPVHYWAGSLRLDTPAPTGGTGTLYYWAKWPTITDSAASLLPDVGDQACLSYALYRFFKRLASSRSDYRLYASLRQANGVTIDDLDAISERHLDDFKDAREDLADEAIQPEQYYED